MNNKKNIITAILQQFVSIISGFILPRLIITSFGSEVNGLVSSITQFLSFISLLEGGLGAVILAELYKPIEEGDDNRIRDILTAGNCFFNRLVLAFIAYTAVVSLIFPLLSDGNFSFGYVCSLVWILSISTLIHYVFSITNKLYLQASQKVYIVNIATALVVVANLIVAVIVIKVFPNIHAVKITSGLVYLIQPIIYSRYVDKKFRIKRRTLHSDLSVLKNRWDGFVQNLAHFINMNTDIAVLTVLVGLTAVSVYSVHMTVIHGLVSMLTIVSSSYQSALGKYYVQGDQNLLRSKFTKFNDINWCVCLAIFCTCLLLINPFIRLYTSDINDADYYQPQFALIIIFAYMIYCIREPYRYLVLAAGKFKQTNSGSYTEAIINLGVSIALAHKFGLIGIATGTFIAILYRFLYLLIYLQKNVLGTKLISYMPNILITVIIVSANIAVYVLYEFSIQTVMDFILYGAIIFLAESVSVGFLFMVLHFKSSNQINHVNQSEEKC